jgi:ketosteroid isomerase-like protein
MSQENVLIVRRLTEALNARAFDTYYVEFFDPGVEWQTAAEDPDAATHRGREAYKRYVEQWLDGFDGMHVEIEESIDVDGDRVFTWSRFTGRGRMSGAPADWHLAIVFTIRDGKVMHAEEYFDRDQALDAAGLSH